MNRLSSIRRWGVAALTGVTLFGGLSIIGAGVASATVQVTAGFASAVSIPGTQNSNTAPATLADGSNLTVTISGAIAAGDQLTFTLGCPSVGTAAFGAVGQTTVAGAASTTTNTGGVTGPTDLFGGASLGVISTAGGCSTLTYTATAPDASAAVTTLTVPAGAGTPGTGITYRLDGVAAGTLTVTGTYSSLGVVQYSFPTTNDANVNSYTVTPSTQSLGAAGSYTTTTLNPITFGDTATNITPAVTNGDVISLALPGAAGTSSIWASAYPGSTSGVGTVTAAGTTVTSATPTINAVPVTLGGVSYSAGKVLSFTVAIAPFTTIPANSTTAFWTISGAQVDILNSVDGAVTANVYDTQTSNAVTPVVTTFDMFMGLQVGTVGAVTNTIFGADGTPDGTVAAEFLNAYPYNTASGQFGNPNVVLATDTPSANGSDALAASYLEGTLHTGLLITPATSLGVDAQEAMRLDGVSTVYIVGGPLAISNAVIAQIKALPVYMPGGLTLAGGNVQVVGPIYGADGTAAGTAAKIAQQFGMNYGAATFPLAYTATGGAYNDTTGSASTVAPSGSVALPTAIVVASTDWQDAMAIAPEAFAKRFPVILAGPSTSTTLGADAQAALTALNVKQVIIIGGQLAVQNSVETQIAALNGGISVLRIAGIDATDTAAQIANFAYSTAGNNSGLGWTAAMGFGSIMVSHADYWSDALGAAALGGGAAYGYSPILLTENPTTIGAYTMKELGVVGGMGVTGLTVLGGPLAMPATTVSAMLAGL